MAKYQLLLPKMGESVAEATIIKWLKKPGDMVEADEAVMEIATDKVDSEVPSPVSGKLVEQKFNENDVVQVGAVIAVIETAAEEETSQIDSHVPPSGHAIESEPQPVFNEIPGIQQLEHRAEPVNSSAVSYGDSYRFYSPLVKSIAKQEGLSAAELDQIPGTGAEGRLTKDDLLNYLQHRTQPQQQPVFRQAEAKEQVAQPSAKPIENNVTPVVERQAPPVSVPQPTVQKAAEQKPVQPAQVSVSGEDEIIEMDRMRKLIADHMVMSVQTSPHVTSFVEVDVTNVVQWRDRVRKNFESREGQKITYTPIFVEAVARAIKDMPMVNVSVNGTQIIKKKNINIGMATALPSGNLIVPVIKKADELNLVGLAKAVNGLAERARANKLQPDEIKDGTFTITNVGTFGNVMGTPIINQPQVAILALGAIKKKPAVIETPTGDVIAIRHMMFLSLSYDHRVVDGALGGSFIRRVADYLESWDINREV